MGKEPYKNSAFWFMVTCSEQWEEKRGAGFGGFGRLCAGTELSAQPGKKRQRAVLAHAKRVRTVRRLSCETQCVVVQNLWILIFVSLTPPPKLYPLKHTFHLEVLPDPRQVRKPRVARSWSWSKDFTVMTRAEKGNQTKPAKGKKNMINYL